MNEKYYKYATLLLKRGLCINEYEPLVIQAPIESIDFVRVLTKVACELNITDIYYDWYDDEIKHIQLQYFNIDNIKESRFWNKEIHNEYAKKNAAFLFLIDSNPTIMKDIDPIKMKEASNTSLLTRNIYREKQSNNQIDWCIAPVATKVWGDLIYQYDTNSKDKLWELIFDICLINTENPLKSWDTKMQKNKKICQKLTNLNIKTLHYTNSLGTDLTIELSNNSIWCGGSSIINGREPIVNIPTEEVFTTPNKHKTNGVVYSSIPLIHGGILIKDICLEFTNGKVTKLSASEGESELRNIIEMDSESCMLGEAALVDINSKISKSNILFYETLFDENASCHLALGRGFKECLENGINLTEEQLEDVGYNKSKTHVDFMIGTKDLNITAVTYDNQEIELFKNGSFNI